MSNISLIDGHIDNAEHCVCCGAVIPEGRQVCIICGLKTNYKQSTADVVDVVRCKDCKNLMFSETQSRTKQAPEGYKVNPEFIETKTKRVQLLLQPSVVDAIKALAKRQGLSMNEAISQAIQEYVEKNNG